MIAVSPHDRGCVLTVRAQPGAKRSAVLGERDGALRVSVTAAPDKGKANEAIVELLADALKCRRSQVTLLSGPTSRSKAFLIEGMSVETLAERLAAW